VLQAVAAGLLGAVLLLPSLRAGCVRWQNLLLQDNATAFRRASAGLSALSPALRETWRVGQRTMMAAAMGVLSLRWEVAPVSCSPCDSPSDKLTSHGDAARKTILETPAHPWQLAVAPQVMPRGC